jgi:hypothetical protein
VIIAVERIAVYIRFMRRHPSKSPWAFLAQVHAGSKRVLIAEDRRMSAVSLMLYNLIGRIGISPYPARRRFPGNFILRSGTFQRWFDFIDQALE